LVEWWEHIFWGSRTKAPYFLTLLFSQILVSYCLELPCHPLSLFLGSTSFEGKPKNKGSRVIPLLKNLPYLLLGEQGWG